MLTGTTVRSSAATLGHLCQITRRWGTTNEQALALICADEVTLFILVDGFSLRAWHRIPFPGLWVPLKSGILCRLVTLAKTRGWLVLRDTGLVGMAERLSIAAR